MLCRVEDLGSATIAELVAATGLHENTVRGHLERLCADGYLRHERTTPVGRGRPSLRWSVLRTVERDAYAGLAISMIETLSAKGAEGAELLRSAGVAWGGHLAAARGVVPHAGREARQFVFDTMRDQGFEPQEGAGELLLRRCPILEAAERGGDAVCAAHQGMLEGLLSTAAGEATPELLPFARAGACVLRFESTS